MSYEGILIDLESKLSKLRIKPLIGTSEEVGLTIFEIKKAEFYIEAFKKAKAFDAVLKSIECSKSYSHLAEDVIDIIKNYESGGPE